MNKRVTALCIGITLLCSPLSVGGEEISLTKDQLQDLYKMQSIKGEKVVLGNRLKEATYTNYLDDYQLLEDGIEQLDQVMETLDKMIGQTIEKGEAASTRDEEKMTMTLGELEDMSSESGVEMDQNDVRIVEVKVDEEDEEAIKDGVADDAYNQLPDEVKDQLPDNWKDYLDQVDYDDLPDEVKDQIDYDDLPDEVKNEIQNQIDKQIAEIDYNNINVPDYLEGVEVTLAIDSKAYYFKMVLPQLMNQLAEVKGTYNELIRNNQVDVYVEMETLKVLNEDANLERVRNQEDMVEVHKFQEMMSAYVIAEKSLEVLLEKEAILKEELDDAWSKYDLGLIALTEVNAKEVDLLQVKEAINTRVNDRDSYYNQLIYNLDLDPQQQYDFTITMESSGDSVQVLDYEEFYSIVMKQSIDMMTLKEQIRVYDELQELAEEVYSSNDFSLQLVTLNHYKKDLEYNKLIQSYTLLIEKVYKDYLVAVDQEKESEEVVDAARKSYDIYKQRYQIGLISDQEYKQSTMLMHEQELNYFVALQEGEKSRNAYIRALNGIIDTTSY